MAKSRKRTASKRRRAAAPKRRRTVSRRRTASKKSRRTASRRRRTASRRRTRSRTSRPFSLFSVVSRKRSPRVKHIYHYPWRYSPVRPVIVLKKSPAKAKSAPRFSPHRSPKTSGVRPDFSPMHLPTQLPIGSSPGRDGGVVFA